VAARLEVNEGLAALGVRVYESQANFAWLDLPESVDEGAVVQGLADRGVLVRAGAALGRAGALRVTYGTSDENARFLAALGELVA
jgi:histidinol-phosphate aminotransferase